MTIFMYYVVNIWCVRESPDLISGGMFVSDKQWNVSYIHVVYSCSLPDKVEEEHSCGMGRTLGKFIQWWHVCLRCIHMFVRLFQKLFCPNNNCEIHVLCMLVSGIFVFVWLTFYSLQYKNTEHYNIRTLNITICIILRGKLKEATTGYKSHVHRGGNCDPSCLIRYNQLLSNSAAHLLAEASQWMLQIQASCTMAS